jgi:hypothetical protein
VGTVRQDGAPRISPVEAHIVRGQLMLVMIGSSWKARDLARDPRVTLQSPVTNPAEPGEELKLRGVVVEASEAERAATSDAVAATSGWRPAASWRFLAVDVGAVALVGWERGEMVLRRWDRERGLRRPARRRLDVEASAYRPVT